MTMGTYGWEGVDSQTLEGHHDESEKDPLGKNE